MQIITNKITVPVQEARISRPRLLKQLEQSLETHSATVICGRAGTGKSMLAAEFAGACGRPTAWFKVDGSDDDPEVFFRYLFASVRTLRNQFCERWEKIFRVTADAGDMQLLADFFVSELQEQPNEPLLIVLDDLHLVYDTPWIAPFFTRLIPLLPHHVHLLLCGRSLPPGPLWRARSKQILSVIDESALAFTADEARQLFAGNGSAEAVSGALRKSRGRASVLDEIATHSTTRMAAGPPALGWST